MTVIRLTPRPSSGMTPGVSPPRGHDTNSRSNRVRIDRRGVGCARPRFGHTKFTTAFNITRGPRPVDFSVCAGSVIRPTEPIAMPSSRRMAAADKTVSPRRKIASPTTPEPVMRWISPGLGMPAVGCRYSPTPGNAPPGWATAYPLLERERHGHTHEVAIQAAVVEPRVIEVHSPGRCSRG